MKSYHHQPRLVFEHPITRTRLRNVLPAFRVCADCGEPVEPDRSVDASTGVERRRDMKPEAGR